MELRGGPPIELIFIHFDRGQHLVELRGHFLENTASQIQTVGDRTLCGSLIIQTNLHDLEQTIQDSSGLVLVPPVEELFEVPGVQRTTFDHVALSRCTLRIVHPCPESDVVRVAEVDVETSILELIVRLEAVNMPTDETCTSTSEQSAHELHARLLRILKKYFLEVQSVIHGVIADEVVQRIALFQALRDRLQLQGALSHTGWRGHLFVLSVDETKG